MKTILRASFICVLFAGSAAALTGERMATIPLEKMTPAQRSVADAIMTGPRKSIGGPFNAWLRSPELADRLQKVGEYLRFDTSLDTRIRSLDGSLDNKIRTFDESVDGRIKNLEVTFDTRAQSVTQTIDNRLGALASAMTDGATQAIQSIDSRLTHLTVTLTDGTAQAVEAVDRRISNVTETIDGRSAYLADTITARFQEIHQGIDLRAGAAEAFDAVGAGVSDTEHGDGAQSGMGDGEGVGYAFGDGDDRGSWWPDRPDDRKFRVGGQHGDGLRQVNQE